MESATPRHSLSRRARFGFAKVMLLASLSAAPVVAVKSTDNYLQRSGPPALRFAPASAKPSQFAWPAQASVNLNATNKAGDSASASVPVVETNSPINGTNAAALGKATETVLESFSPALEMNSEPNSLSASNLLLVTPQMLADYFKTNFDPGFRWLTNGFAPMEVPFNPPIPKQTPASEASYRIQ